MRTGDLALGKTTVFLQIPLTVLQTTPAVGRVLVGALLNAAYQADGRVQGRVLFLLDEVARLGYMQVLEQARDAGRKYGITLLLLYQSLGQLVAQWGREGKQAWYDSTSWRLFAAVQDPTPRSELSAMCGEYGVVATSQGDTEGSQARSGIASSSSGRSENRSEVKRALIKPDELTQDTRTDEAFILVRGASRCAAAAPCGSAAPSGPAWSGPTASTATIRTRRTSHAVVPAPRSRRPGGGLRRLGAAHRLRRHPVPALHRRGRLAPVADRHGLAATASGRCQPAASPPPRRQDGDDDSPAPAAVAPVSRPSRKLERALAELDGMVGLASVKAEISKLIDVLAIESERARHRPQGRAARPALRVPRQPRHRQDHGRPPHGRDPARARLPQARPPGRGGSVHPGRRLRRPHRHPGARDRPARPRRRAVRRRGLQPRRHRAG